MYDLWWLVVAFMVLGGISIYDVRRRRIPVTGMAVVLIMAIIYRYVSDEGAIELMDIIWSVSPGLLLICLSFITEGRIGMGDGIMIAEIGLGVGLTRCVYILMGALMICCVFSGALLALHKADRKTQIPFMPFVTIGLGVMALACG